MQLGRVHVNQNSINKIAFQKNWFSKEQEVQQDPSKKTGKDYVPDWTWSHGNDARGVTPQNRFADPTPVVEKSITTIINTCARSIGKTLPEGWEFKFPEAKPRAMQTDTNPIVF